MGNGYLGTSEILTSVANEDITPNTPDNWTFDKYKFYKFSFINKESCRVKINNGNPIYLEANQGFESARGDQAIEKFVIVDASIPYSWIGTY